MGRIAWWIALLACFGIATLAILPRMFRATCEGSNETAAIATLRNLGTVQAGFRDRRLCDVDGDGTGEFGTFAEMTGKRGIRADAAGTVLGAPLSLPVLTRSLENTDDQGTVFKSGYAYRIYLPAKGGGAVHEGLPALPRTPRTGPLLSGPVDVDASESRWCAYAWPVSHGNSGIRAFFIDTGGDIWWTANTDGRYRDRRAPPPWDAAMPAGAPPGWAPSPATREHRGRDGNLWVRSF